MQKEPYVIYDDKFERTENGGMKYKIHCAVSDVADWFNRNKEAVLLLGPAALGAVTTVVKVIGKRANLSKEKKVKEYYCYDRSLGHYWALRRNLTNTEWVQVDKRKKNGERLADILSDLKVLK